MEPRVQESLGSLGFQESQGFQGSQRSQEFQLSQEFQEFRGSQDLKAQGRPQAWAEPVKAATVSLTPSHEKWRKHCFYLFIFNLNFYVTLIVNGGIYFFFYFKPVKYVIRCLC